MADEGTSERSGASRLTGRFNVFNVISDIRARLSESNIKRFKSSCFGRFLDVHPITFNEKLVNQLVMCMIVDEDETVIKFRCNGMHVEFNKLQYFLVTGLKFGTKENLPQRSYFHERAFGGESIVYVGNIQNRFHDECNDTKGNSDESFRLAMVFFVYGVLFNEVGRYTKPIDIKYMHVIDDITLFNDYPWANGSYQFMVTSMIEAFRSTRDTRLSQNERWGEVRGLTLVLQLWAYECFPFLAHNLSCIEDGHITVWPRMIRRWAEVENISIVIDSLCKEGRPTKYRPMTATEYEQDLVDRSSLSYGGLFPKFVEYPHTNLDKTKRKLHFKEQQTLSAERTHGVSNKYTTPPSKKSCPWTAIDEEGQRNMLSKAMKLERDLNKLQCSATTPFHKELLELTKTLTCIAKYTLNFGNEVSPEYSARTTGYVVQKPLVYSGDENRNPATIEDVSMSMPSPDWVKDSPYTLKPKINTKERKDFGGFKQLKDVIDITDDGTEELNTSGSRAAYPKKFALLPINTLTYYEDPLAKCQLEDVVDVINWYNEAVAKEKNPTIETNLKHSSVLDAMWFEFVIIHTNWLRSDSCDVILNMLMREANVNPYNFVGDWVALDSLAFARIECGNKEEAMVAMSSYMEGRHPIERPRRWGRVRYVYGIANVNNSHWVAYKVDLVEENISVYDSLGGYASSSASLKQCFHKMSKFMPWACRLTCVSDLLGCVQSKAEEWKVVVVAGVPQQLNGHDCGIMALKFIQCMM